MPPWMKDNKITSAMILTMLVLAAGVVATFAVLSDDMGEMEPKVAEHGEKIVDLEKADIGIQAAVTALATQQAEYHEDEEEYRRGRDNKLAAILSAVEKGNASR